MDDDRRLGDGWKLPRQSPIEYVLARAHTKYVVLGSLCVSAIVCLTYLIVWGI